MSNGSPASVPSAIAFKCSKGKVEQGFCNAYSVSDTTLAGKTHKSAKERDSAC